MGYFSAPLHLLIPTLRLWTYSGSRVTKGKMWELGPELQIFQVEMGTAHTCRVQAESLQLLELLFSSCHHTFSCPEKQVQRCRWGGSAKVWPSEPLLGIMSHSWSPLPGRVLGCKVRPDLEAGASGLIPFSQHLDSTFWFSVSVAAATSWMSPPNLKGAVAPTGCSNRSGILALYCHSG